MPVGNVATYVKEETSSSSYWSIFGYDIISFNLMAGVITKTLPREQKPLGIDQKIVGPVGHLEVVITFY